MTIAEHALEMIADGFVVGLGTGRAATAFVRALGQRVQQGLRVLGVPTSQATAQVALEVGVPLANLDEVRAIDIAVDGADEVDPGLNLIKGYGGALVREKIIAAAARRFVVLVGKEKLVPVLGQRGSLPVEVVPFAVSLSSRLLEQIGLPPRIRTVNDMPFISDNHNYILDCQVGPITDPAGLNHSLCALPGVVDTGLFVGMADLVLVQDGPHVQVLEL